MVSYVVYQVEYGADVDGRGPECWRCGEVARVDTEAEADAFAETFYDYCEVDVED